MENEKNYVSLSVAKLLKKAGWHLGSECSYIKEAYAKNPKKKLWGKIDRVDDLLYYCHLENEDGTKAYPDLNEKDWITWKYTLVNSWWKNSEKSYMRWEMYEAPLISEVLTRLEDEKHYCISIKCNGYKSYMYEIREFHLVDSVYQEKHYEFGMPMRGEDRHSVVNDAITVVLKRIIEEKGKQKEGNSINT